jgi:hypothetical protein
MHRVKTFVKKDGRQRFRRLYVTWPSQRMFLNVEQCGGRMKTLDAIHSPDKTRKTLDSLGLRSCGPKTKPPLLWHPGGEDVHGGAVDEGRLGKLAGVFNGRDVAELAHLLFLWISHVP